MFFLKFIERYINNASLEFFLENELYLRKVGFLGYFLGYFTLFLAFKVMKMIPGDYISFFFFFSILLIFDYIFSAIINLFMDMIGYRKSASNLFYYFGISNFIWILSLPFAFISEISSGGWTLFFSFLMLSYFLFRLKIIKLIYKIRYKMALITFSIPYILLNFLFFAGGIYTLYWIFSLVI